MTTAGDAQELAYRIDWRTSSVRAGVHRGRLRGSAGQFKDHAPLIDEPDPRRIDIRASLRDPFQRILVKRSERTAEINVVILADVSLSMAFRGHCDKLDIAASLAAALAGCARRAGDRFGLTGFDAEINEQLVLHPTRSSSAQREAVDRLRAFAPVRPSASGIAAAAARLPSSRSLVFIVSDFLWQPSDAAMASSALGLHDVVPVVIEDTAAVDDMPERGIVYLRDLETGAGRLVLLRPSLKAKWRVAARDRRREVLAALTAVARPALTITNAIDWDRLAASLLHGGYE